MSLIVLDRPAFSIARLPGLAAWYDASRITGIADGGTIAQWDDLSGFARHAVQATEADKPTYQTVEQGGLPGVLFDGVSDFLGLTGGALDMPDFTIFAVMRRRLTTVALPAVGGTGENVSQWSDGKAYINCSTGFLVSHNLNPNTAVGASMTWKKSAGTYEIYQGGVSLGSGTGTAANTLTPAYLGRVSTTFGDGHLHEIIVCSAALSDSTRAKTERYLRKKWGTP